MIRRGIARRKAGRPYNPLFDTKKMPLRSGKGRFSKTTQIISASYLGPQPSLRSLRVCKEKPTRISLKRSFYGKERAKSGLAPLFLGAGGEIPPATRLTIIS